MAEGIKTLKEFRDKEHATLSTAIGNYLAPAAYGLKYLNRHSFLFLVAMYVIGIGLVGLIRARGKFKK